MKTIFIPNTLPNISPTEIRYTIYDSKCVFSQNNFTVNTLSSFILTSEIVSTICKQENLNLHEMLFYDFQSSRGYHCMFELDPGAFEFLKITLDEKGNAIAWEEVLCPPEIVQDFGIGQSPKQLNLPK